MKEAALGAFVRHAAQAAGVWLAARGYLTGEEADLFAAAAVAVVMFGWSMLQKVRASRAKQP